MVATSVANVDAQSSENPSVELAQADELGGSVTTEETVYTSALAESLGENLLQVNVSSQSAQPAPTNAGELFWWLGDVCNRCVSGGLVVPAEHHCFVCPLCIGNPVSTQHMCINAVYNCLYFQLLFRSDVVLCWCPNWSTGDAGGRGLGRYGSRGRPEQEPADSAGRGGATGTAGTIDSIATFRFRGCSNFSLLYSLPPPHTLVTLKRQTVLFDKNDCFFSWYVI